MGHFRNLSLCYF